MTKLTRLIDDLDNAIKQLDEATQLEKTRINQDATIQRFEFTFELAWKVMQELGRESDRTTYGPRNSIREAGNTGIIDNVELWMTFLESRNMTVHTYNEATANEVYEKAKEFVPIVKTFQSSVAAYVSS
ncbi:MAG: HI0074 family nucleotidyltransferase substrate-binding subunit [bacterium]|nr:HI0074 family nucleotidyltransferase substrate-binding subunit [bacterium]